MRFYVLVSLLFLALYSSAQTINFRFDGSITNMDNGGKEGGVTISIVQGGSTVASTTSASNGRYLLKSPINYKTPFSVVFSKGGMVTKRVDFNLAAINEEDLPASAEYKPVDKLDMEIFQERPDIDFSFLSTQAMTTFSFDNRKAAAIPDMVTANKMRQKIEKLLLEAEQKGAENEAKYQAAIQAADNAYNGKKYEEALKKYEEALQYKPKEKHPADRILELDALIQKQKEEALAQQQADAGYLKLIKEADQLRDGGQLQTAIGKYEEALKLKNEQYPKDEITALKKRIEDKKKEDELNAKYNEAIELADIYYKQGSFKAAKDKYTEALTFKPNEKYPKDRLALIEVKLKEQQDIEILKKKYEEAVKAGDELFAQKKYAESKTKYQEALSIEKSATYPVGKIKEIDQILASENAEKEKLAKIEQLLKEGQTAFDAKKWVDAKSKYNEVLGLDAVNAIAKVKIVEIDQKIKEESDLAAQEKKFNELVKKGDQEFTGTKFEDAKNSYSTALAIKEDPAVRAKLESTIAKLKDLSDQKAKKEAYDKAMADGEGLMSAKKYEDAKSKFLEAKTIDPTQALPQQKIDQINQLLASQAADKEKAEKYAKAMADGEGFLTSQKYEDAKSKFQEAKSIDPSQTLPQQKIDQINQLLASQAADKEKAEKYSKAMADGESLLSAKKYDDAKSKFQEARTIDPSQSLPQQKIDQINQLLTAQAADKEKAEKYAKAMADGENMLTAKKYEDAKSKFQEAKTIDPSQSLPQQKIDQINQLLTAQAAEKEKAEKYAKTMADGESLLIAKKYEEAKSKFQEAKSIDPVQTLPQQKIDQINQLLAAQASDKEKAEKYAKAMADGESLLTAKKYEDAKSKFQEAKILDPSQSLPQEKIDQINQLLAAQASDKEKAEKYAKAMTDGENLLTAKKYDDAKSKFQEAKTIDPSQTLPQQKIDQINQILSAQASDKEKAEKYAKAMTEGENLLTAKKYEDAKSKFQEAKALDPSQTLPQQKIDQINQLLTDQAAKSQVDRQYQELLKKGDELVSQKDYVGAIKSYNDALALKPTEQEPVIRAERAQRLADEASNTEEDIAYQKILDVAREKITQNDLPKAKDLLTRALSLRPNESRAEAMMNEVAGIERLRKEFDDLMKAAELEVAGKNYDLAISKLEQAKAKIPADPRPNQRIDEIRQMMSASQEADQKERLYKEYIMKGAAAYEIQSFESALSEYKNALNIKPNDVIATAKIKEIQAIIDARTNANNAEVERKRQFDAFVKEADDFFEIESYLTAKTTYEKALAIYPDNSYVKQQVDECIRREKLKGQEEFQKEYQKLITTADNYFNTGGYDRAKELYQRAIGLNAGDPYPKKKLDEIEAILNPTVVEAAKLEPLGEPFDSSIIDGEAALQDAEVQRKGLKIRRMKARVDAIHDKESGMSTAKYQEHVATTNDIYDVYKSVSIDAGQKDLNRQAIVEALRTAEKERETIEENEVLMAHAQNVNKQLTLDIIETEHALEYHEDISVYMDNSLTMENYNKALAEDIRLSSDKKHQSSLDANVELNNKTSKIQSDYIENFDKRKEFEDEVEKIKLASSNEAMANEASKYQTNLDDNVKIGEEASKFESDYIENFDKRKQFEGEVEKIKIESENEAMAIEASKYQSNLDDNAKIGEEASKFQSDYIENFDKRKQFEGEVDKIKIASENEAMAKEASKYQSNLDDNAKIGEEASKFQSDYIENFDKRKQFEGEVEKIKLASSNEAMANEVSKYQTNLDDNAKIGEEASKFESDYIENFEKRKEFEGEVAKVKFSAENKATEAEKSDYQKNVESAPVIEGIYRNVEDKATEDALLARENKSGVEEIETSVIQTEADKIRAAQLHALDTDNQIRNVKIKIADDDTDRDANRREAVEDLKESDKQFAEDARREYNKEMSKYLVNKQKIEDNTEINDITEKINVAQDLNVSAVESMSNKAITQNEETKMSDQQERMQARSSVETAASNQEVKFVEEKDKRAGSTQSLTDLTKTINQNEINHNDSQKDKNLSTQEAINKVDREKAEKPIIANTLGDDYPEGVSQETFQQKDQDGLVKAIITRRIVVIEGRGDVYVRTQSVQSTTYTKNGSPITEYVWQKETQGAHLERHY